MRSRIILPSLDPRARFTSFYERARIKKCYREILGMNGLDHFSINAVPTNNQMLVFSIKPELAYELYSTQKGISQDLAISPTYYENNNFYFWEDCYDPAIRAQVMHQKEERAGITAGAVIMHEQNGVKYLLSFGTSRSSENFKQDLKFNTGYFKKIGRECLDMMGFAIQKYVRPEPIKKRVSIIVPFGAKL